MVSERDETQIRHVYERWHETVMRQDLQGLLALYADHAVMETPAILAMFPDRSDGVLRGRAQIEELFARNFKALAAEFRELYRSGLFFSNGRQLTWEYPRATPRGDQVDLFESMDVEGGLIVYHRVYWGWKGLKTLIAVRDKQPG